MISEISRAFYKSSRFRKAVFVTFTVLITLFVMGQMMLRVGAVSAADDKIKDSNTRSMVQIQNGLTNLIREVEFNILYFLSKVIDYFDEAIDLILGINLYDQVKNKFNTSNIYPLAWALFSLAIIILGIMLIWHNDKLKISESAKSIIMSAIVIIAMPTFFASLNDMKTSGVSDVKTVSNSNSGFSLGQEMLLNSIIYIPGSDKDHKVTVDQTDMVQDILNSGTEVDGEPARFLYNDAFAKVRSHINATASHDTIGATLEDELHDKPTDDWEIIVATITNFGYPEEKAYIYYIDFWFNVVLMCVTIVCLIFAGIKLSSLLFDIVFIQIIAPLVIASDLNGSGRAKKIIQHTLSTYIIFIVVFLLLRLYLIIIHGVRSSSEGNNFAVLIMITIAGAKFVIDGPDILVQILGIDAGVKSGAATLMGMHSAAQMATGTARAASNTARSVASAPAKVGGFIGNKAAAAQKTMSAPGIGGKIKAAASNSSAGQAFKQAYSGHSQTNESYSYAAENAPSPNIHPITGTANTIGKVGGHIANGAGSVVNSVKKGNSIYVKDLPHITKEHISNAASNQAHNISESAKSGYNSVRKYPANDETPNGNIETTGEKTYTENESSPKTTNSNAAAVYTGDNTARSSDNIPSDSNVTKGKAFNGIQNTDNISNAPNALQPPQHFEISSNKNSQKEEE